MAVSNAAWDGPQAVMEAQDVGEVTQVTRTVFQFHIADLGVTFSASISFTGNSFSIRDRRP